MRREVTVREDQLLVRVTIPARFVAKTFGSHWKQAPETAIYKLISDSFGVTLGRCNWQHPVEIVGTPHQFGIFMALIKDRGHDELAGAITYHLFTPDKTPPIHRFNAVGNKLHRLTVRAEIMDSQELLEA